MVEVSRDGKRVYWTSSLSGAWDDQFFPAGVDAWRIKEDVDLEDAGMALDPAFFPHGADRAGLVVVPHVLMSTVSGAGLMLSTVLH